jgi:RNA polymerase sigma factor (sigma-70 family)
VDKEKFISIVKDNQQLIYKICRTYCNNSELRKDLEQEILVQLWKSLPRFDGRVKISTWIYRVALNTAFLFHRNESKHKENKVDIDNSVFSIAETIDATEFDEKIEKLYQFIYTLDDLDKALMMLYLEESKYKEIAEILGITETNVATKIGRIKNKLKDYFLNN